MKKVTIAMALASMLSLVLVVYVMKNIDVYVASGCALVSDLYLFSLTGRRKKKEDPRIEPAPKKRLPALFFIVVIIPIAASITLFSIGLLGPPLEAAVNTLIVVGFSVTFFFVSFSIPLALRQKVLEEHRKIDPSYHPLVSILVPAYNEELVITRTLESLVKQTYPNREIIVIDDGSKDSTYLVASWYKQFGVKVLQKTNGGKARALNYGLLFSRGEIIVTVDADSILNPDAISEIVKLMGDRTIYAAAGNVKALNTDSVVTRCQQLEYITAINTLRRSLDMFGGIAVVPGAFGVFRRDAIENTGGYDPDTVAEDFDLTLKIQKAYGSVAASSTAVAKTEVPATWRNLYRQRYRWAKGTYQALLKHRDAFLNQRFGVLHSIVMPLLLISMVVPFATYTAIGAGVYLALHGDYMTFLFIIAIFMLIQFLVALLALSLDNERLSLARYSVLLVWGYRQFLDAILIYVTLNVLLAGDKKRTEWARVDRVGGNDTTTVPVPDAAR